MKKGMDLTQRLRVEGAFRFTRWLESKKACLGWFQHFQERGIPCGLVERTGNGTSDYSIFRSGKEAGDDSEKLDPEKIRLVQSSGGFVLAWGNDLWLREAV